MRREKETVKRERERERESVHTFDTVSMVVTLFSSGAELAVSTGIFLVVGSTNTTITSSISSPTCTFTIIVYSRSMSGACGCNTVLTHISFSSIVTITFTRTICTIRAITPTFVIVTLKASSTYGTCLARGTEVTILAGLALVDVRSDSGASTAALWVSKKRLVVVVGCGLEVG